MALDPRDTPGSVGRRAGVRLVSQTRKTKARPGATTASDLRTPKFLVRNPLCPLLLLFNTVT